VAAFEAACKRLERKGMLLQEGNGGAIVSRPVKIWSTASTKLLRGGLLLESTRVYCGPLCDREAESCRSDGAEGGAAGDARFGTVARGNNGNFKAAFV